MNMVNFLHTMPEGSLVIASMVLARLTINKVNFDKEFPVPAGVPCARRRQGIRL